MQGKPNASLLFKLVSSLPQACQASLYVDCFKPDIFLCVVKLVYFSKGAFAFLLLIINMCNNIPNHTILVVLRLFVALSAEKMAEIGLASVS